MKKILLCFALFLNLYAGAQHINIIPQPQKVELTGHYFYISPKTSIFIENEKLLRSADFLNQYLQKYYGFSLPVTKDVKKDNVIILESAGNAYDLDDKKSIIGKYNITSNHEKLIIKGNDDVGTFYGIQTLIQLLPIHKSQKLKIHCVNVEDAPRFGYRGLMLDVCRHYMPLSFVKQYIDLIALHKLNTFHWHLTEDQGWRIEIKKYPKLTEVGAWRNGTIIGRYPGSGNDSIRTGGYYTQEEIKEIVKYAADRYITVIPEIEMPGHSSAAIAAYPALSCFPEQSTELNPRCAWSGSRDGKQVQQTWGVFDDVYAPTDYTFTFLENVLDEVINLFPSAYIHIGGDECPKTYWKKSPFCQNLIKEKGLKDEHELQSYFIQRIEKYLNGKGKKLIGWDEILEGGLAPNATVMSWRGEAGGIEAAKQKHDVIMTPGYVVYFDHSQVAQNDSLTIGGYSPIQKVYNYEPIPSVLDAESGKYVLGAQANVWTEYMKTPEKVQYQVLPRLSALSETLWSPKEIKNYTNFKHRLSTQIARYELWGMKYNVRWDNQPDTKDKPIKKKKPVKTKKKR